MSAALTLREAGHEVTVLEASERVGGRVFTVRDGFSPGIHAEAGASFVPGSHSLTVGYALFFGLTLVPLDPKGLSVDYLHDRRIEDKTNAKANWPVALNDFERANPPTAWIHKYLAEPMRAVLATAPRSASWPPDSVAHLDKMSYRDVLAANGASDGAISILRLGFSDLWGDGIDDCSALLLLRDDAFSMAGDPGTSAPTRAPTHPASRHFVAPASGAAPVSASAPGAISAQGVYRVDGGTDGIALGFAARLGSAIRLNAPVVRIEQDAHEVRVRCASGGEPLVVDRVICALPFSALRDVEIEPAFSAPKARAVQELPYTSVARIFLEFPTRFWLADGFSGIASTDLPESPDTRIPGFWLEDATLGQDTPRGILDCYVTGEWARRITAMDPERRIAMALDVVDRVYPGARANFSGKSAMRCWDEDPWEKGDYCWFRPGQMSALYPAIAPSEGRIHFAGDHASALPGWMQGALESGLRAAGEVNSA